MINLTELRLGNYFLFDSKPFRVKGVDYNHVLYLEFGGSSIRKPLKKDQIDPVPLTDKILEQADFNWNESIRHWVKTYGRNGVCFIKKDPHYPGSYSYQLGDGYYKVLYYLHELQNLFFSITNIELEFKPSIDE